MSNSRRNTRLENVWKDFTQIGNSEAGGFLKLNQVIPASKSIGTVEFSIGGTAKVERQFLKLNNADSVQDRPRGRL